ncbi:MAG: hypothetical protein OEZ06_01065 [Myxococcales bacterium]|nr:hypothetical protein [Myxococcales bacterium]
MQLAMTDAAERAETWREAEAYLVTLALGVVGVGFLLLVYASGPARIFLASGPQPVALDATALEPGRVAAAGSWVDLGPTVLDFSRAKVRLLPSKSDGDSTYAAYVPIVDADGRTLLVVRLAGYDSQQAVPAGRVRMARLQGVLLRHAPALLARMEDWPGDGLRQQGLIDRWILLADERPPRLGDFAPLAGLGLALFVLPLLAIAARFLRPARKRS